MPPAHAPAFLLAPLCLVTAIGGLAWMTAHESTPCDHRAAASVTPTPTPADLKIGLSDAGAVAVFAHPHCPCTRTTLRNLRDLGDWTHGPTLTVFVVGPAGGNDDWFSSETWMLAESIPGATVRRLSDQDVGRFGIHTSGHVLAFDGAGRTVLDGGITFGRAHEGGNSGLDAIKDLRDARPTSHRVTPVFGCPIADTSACTPTPTSSACPPPSQP